MGGLFRPPTKYSHRLEQCRNTALQASNRCDASLEKRLPYQPYRQHRTIRLIRPIRRTPRCSNVPPIPKPYCPQGHVPPSQKTSPLSPIHEQHVVIHTYAHTNQIEISQIQTSTFKPVNNHPFNNTSTTAGNANLRIGPRQARFRLTASSITKRWRCIYWR